MMYWRWWCTTEPIQGSKALKILGHFPEWAPCVTTADGW